MLADVIFALESLAQEVEELPDEDVLDQLLPELAELCNHLWLLELLVTYCKLRRKRA